VSLNPAKAYALYTTLCDKLCQWLAAGRRFSPVSSTNKTILFHKYVFWNLYKFCIFFLDRWSKVMEMVYFLLRQLWLKVGVKMVYVWTGSYLEVSILNTNTFGKHKKIIYNWQKLYDVNLWMSDRIKIFLKLPYYLISLLLISLVNFVPTMLTTNNNNLYLGSTQSFILTCVSKCTHKNYYCSLYTWTDCLDISLCPHLCSYSCESTMKLSKPNLLWTTRIDRNRKIDLTWKPLENIKK
jgi:hypothetical protein